MDWILLELFTDDISSHAPLVTADFDEDSLEKLEKGIMPKLEALNLHNGTLYKWNRLCYGVHNNVPHLRIENRYVPSGPSIKDEIANALFWVGVMKGMPDDYKNIWTKIPFIDAKSNFLNAARTGLDTYFNWFGEGFSTKKLVKKILLPIARKGLESAKIDANDINYYLGIIEQRVDTNITGSKWLTRNKRSLVKKISNYETNALLTYHTYKNQQQNIPVHKWENITIAPVEISKKYDKLYKVMSTGIFVVNENDLIELVFKIMEWKKIHHVPVMNKDNKIVGLITKDQLRTYDFSNLKNKNIIAKRIMNADFISLSPETSTARAARLMDAEKTCVLVMDELELLGIFTKNDLDRVQNLINSK